MISLLCLQDGILTGDYVLICKVVSSRDPKPAVSAAVLYIVRFFIRIVSRHLEI